MNENARDVNCWSANLVISVYESVFVGQFTAGPSVNLKNAFRLQPQAKHFITV